MSASVVNFKSVFNNIIEYIAKPVFKINIKTKTKFRRKDLTEYILTDEMLDLIDYDRDLLQ